MLLLEKLLIVATLIIYGFLTIFSFAYVDLNLTLSQNQIVLNFVNFMQQFGYYHRQTATFAYLIFVLFAFIFFSFNLLLFYKKRVGLKYLIVSTLFATGTLVFAYPFLSSDLFNYLFDSKIILNYHQNPYTHKPLDFPQDEWLRFMRWTHRYSPYGPLWLVSSLIPAVLGMGKFMLNFFAFKIFIGIFHLVNSYLIFKTLEKINPKVSIFGAATYALNPLFLIEGVANAHNDVVLASLLLASIYAISKGRGVSAFVFLTLGSLIKYIPALNVPWIILKIYKKLEIEKFIILNFLTMAAFTFLFSSFRITVPFVSSGSTQVQFQPWYLFWTLPFISLIPKPNFIVISTATALGASLRYLPYLYYGDWSHPNTVEFMTAITVLVPVIGILFILTRIKFKNV